MSRHLVVIAESDLNDPRVVTSREARRVWQRRAVERRLSPCAVRRALSVADNGLLCGLRRAGQSAHALERVYVYDGIYSGFRNHIQGRPVGGLSRHKFLGYIQNHDQVGNRAVGDRIGHIAGVERAKVAAAVVLMSPFVPMIFQGEEWAASSPFQYFADHDDPAMARAVSEGRKREFAAFGWKAEAIPDPESKETFERSKLHWDELTQAQHAEMLAWYRELIRLRRATPCLNNGEPGQNALLIDEREKWLRMERGSIAVCCNLGKGEHTFPVAEGGRVILASRKWNADKRMGPYTAAGYRRCDCEFRRGHLFRLCLGAENGHHVIQCRLP